MDFTSLRFYWGLRAVRAGLLRRITHYLLVSTSYLTYQSKENGCLPIKNIMLNRLYAVHNVCMRGQFRVFSCCILKILCSIALGSAQLVHERSSSEFLVVVFLTRAWELYQIELCQNNVGLVRRHTVDALIETLYFHSCFSVWFFLAGNQNSVAPTSIVIVVFIIVSICINCF